MKNLLILTVILLTFFSCKHEFEKPYWDVSLASPIAFSTIDLDDISTDSIFSIDTLSDNSLTLVYQNEILDVSIDSNFQLNAISTTKNVKLETIVFPDQTIPHEINFGELIQSTGLGFLFPNDSLRIIPAISGAINDIVPIDANEYFEQMTLNQGFMDITISNNLASDLSNLVINLRNEGEATNLVEINLPYLASGDVFQTTESLANQIIYGDMEIEILNADMVGTGSTPVLIQYQDALATEIKIRDLILEQGIAIFPSQEIFNEDTVVAFDIGDVRLTRVLVDEGGVEVIGVSTVQDTLKIEYIIPGATKDGQEFKLNFNLPPAPVGESMTVVEFFDFSGYEIDLTGQFGDTINTLYTVSRGWIDSSGIVTEISLQDSIFNTITVKEIIPAKAWGYLGSDTISGEESIDFDFFDDLNGSFDLEQLDVSLVTKNFLGSKGEVTIKKLEAVSNSQSISLNSDQINSPFEIEAATSNSDNTITSSELEITFNQDNSNIDELVELKPNAFNFEYEIITNNDLNQELGFAYKGQGVKSELQMKIPVFISLDNIAFSDTVDVDFTIPSDIDQGSFTVLAENGYPLNAQIELLMLDDANNLIETLISGQEILAGEIDQNGIVSAVKLSQLNVPFSNASNLNNTKKVGFRVSFSTSPQNQTVKFYSDYAIKLKLVGNFNYTLGQ
jgi:hypothetical protein|tara:strand:+ start:3345 stop:5375 length:2031 start_codon:yes stop_codon:yes gene_type:complete